MECCEVVNFENNGEYFTHDFKKACFNYEYTC